MKAALLEQIPGELVIDEVQVGTVGPREVLVRTVAAGLCHSDLHFMEAKYPCPVPAVLGHESAGVVEAVGSDVSYVQPGDHVISCISGFCGTCGYCLSGRPHLCDKVGLDAAHPPRLRRGNEPVYQFFALSSFAEQLLVHENMLVKIRPDMPLDKAALIGCGVTTGIGAVLNTARVRPGETVAVIGCGGIGLNAIQAAAMVGAGRIIAIDRIQAEAGPRARRSAQLTWSTRHPSTRSAQCSSSPAVASTTRSKRSGSRRRRNKRSTCCARAAPRS